MIAINQQKRLENYFDKTEFSLNQMGRSLYSHEYDIDDDSSISLEEDLNEDDINFALLIQNIKINFVKSIMIEYEQNQKLLKVNEDRYSTQIPLLKADDIKNDKNDNHTKEQCISSKEKAGIRRIFSSFKLMNKPSYSNKVKDESDNNSSTRRSKFGTVSHSVIGLFNKPSDK